MRLFRITLDWYDKAYMPSGIFSAVLIKDYDCTQHCVIT